MIGCYSATFALPPAPLPTRSGVPHGRRSLAVVDALRPAALEPSYSSRRPHCSRPLPVPLGDSGPHPALAVASPESSSDSPGTARIAHRLDAVTGSLLLLLGVLLASAGCSVIYSGATVAAAPGPASALFGTAV